MPQFAVHRNRNAATKARFPLLLDVQTNLLEDLGTRVVIPLAPASLSHEAHDHADAYAALRRRRQALRRS